MRIDFHCHLTPKTYLDGIEKDPGKWKASIEVREGQRFIRPANYPFPVGFGPLTPGYWDPVARIEHMRAIRVDMEAISAPTYLFYYWADPGLALEVARMTNEAIAAAARTPPPPPFATVACRTWPPPSSSPPITPGAATGPAGSTSATSWASPSTPPS